MEELPLEVNCENSYSFNQQMVGGGIWGRYFKNRGQSHTDREIQGKFRQQVVVGNAHNFEEIRRKTKL